MSLRYSPSNVRTLAAALGRPRDAHDYAITDASTGRTIGIYASEELAMAAVARLVDTSAVYVLTVLHPEHCEHTLS